MFDEGPQAYRVAPNLYNHDQTALVVDGWVGGGWVGFCLCVFVFEGTLFG